LELSQTVRFNVLPSFVSSIGIRRRAGLLPRSHETSSKSNVWGVPVDEKETSRNFKVAAHAGDSSDEMIFGLCLAKGMGVLANVTEAVK
jgi:TPR repeat protein